MVKAEPREMKGIQGLWKIAIDCKDNKVGEAVTQLLLHLHTQLDFGWEEKIPIFEDQFIKACLEIIRDQQRTIAKRTAEEKEAILKLVGEVKGYYIKT
jgi:hypothetical protein